MKKVIYLAFIFLIGFTFTVNGTMKLKLSSDIYNEKIESFGNHNYVSNLKLELPSKVINPGGQLELIKGLFLLGLALDVSFPIGDDFSNFAGTGFSGHAVLAYLIARSIMLTLSAGYISFGQKEFGDGTNFSQTFCHSQIPIILGLNYLFDMKGALRLYLGLALGLFILRDSFTNTFTQFGQTQTVEGDDSSTKFGIVPRAGLYYMTAAIILSMQVSYSLIFHEAGGEGSSNLAHFGILVGLMFALGR